MPPEKHTHPAQNKNGTSGGLNRCVPFKFRFKKSGQLFNLPGAEVGGEH
jgi:hypothetical protein